MLLIVLHHCIVNSRLTLADAPIFADPLSFRKKEKKLKKALAIAV
jgi:hypothetical protein